MISERLVNQDNTYKMMELLEETNKKIIKKSQLEILNDKNIWRKIYENFINDYEEFDPDYEYELEYNLKILFNIYKDCFIWFVLNCGKRFPITIDDLKSNLLEIISSLYDYHDYELEHDIYGIIDYIIEEFKNYFEILTNDEYDKLE